MAKKINQSGTINTLWLLNDNLTVHQAAALIGGIDPNFVLFNEKNEPSHVDNASDPLTQEPISWVRTALLAMINSIKAGKLKARLRYSAREYGYADIIADAVAYTDWNESNPTQQLAGSSAKDNEELAMDGSCFYKPFPDWSLTTVNVDDLVSWLDHKRIHPEFFFPTTTDARDYLDPKNPRYAPKLAAAVMAWEAVTDPKGKSPKDAIKRWVREHAAEFGLGDDEGKPIEDAVEQIGKVANWAPGGGAPKTPGE